MKRMIESTALVLALLLAFGASAYAQNAHLKPPHQNPSFSDNANLTLTVAASVAGLSSDNLMIELDATANATATCTNPAGATQPAGQNPAPVTVAGVLPISGPQIKNGNLSFMLTTGGPQRRSQGHRVAPILNGRRISPTWHSRPLRSLSVSLIHQAQAQWC